MNRRLPLPRELGRGFSVGDARAALVPQGRLRAKDLATLTYGTRVRNGGTLIDAVAAALSPDQAFTGPTAARIWGMPLPRRWQDDPRVWVSTLSRDRSMRRQDVVASRRSSGTPIVIGGYRVLDPARTWSSLGALLAPHDLTAVADRIVTTSPGARALDTSEHLIEAASASRRARRTLLAALSESRSGSRSRPESLLRVAIVRAGLPEPRLNEPVQIARRRVAFPDLAWPDYGVCTEYDGTWHDDARQRAADLERHELLVDAGWTLVHIRARDLFPEPLVAVARILRRLSAAGYRHPSTIERAQTHGWEP